MILSSIGYVLFPGFSDVRYLDLDKIVSFENGCFSMFSELEELPRYGEALNKEFILTLLLDSGA